MQMLLGFGFDVSRKVGKKVQTYGILACSEIKQKNRSCDLISRLIKNVCSLTTKRR